MNSLGQFIVDAAYNRTRRKSVLMQWTYEYGVGLHCLFGCDKYVIASVYFVSWLTDEI